MFLGGHQDDTIKKVYEVDPLTCAKCNSPMRIISFITDGVAIRAITKSLNIPDFVPPPKVLFAPDDPEYLDSG